MITTVILTPDPKKVPQKTLDSVSFSSEILFIPVKGDFSQVRNDAMEQAKNDWILFIDSDEIVIKQLGVEITDVISKGGKGAYYIKRRDYFWNTELNWGETYSARTKGIIRLVKRNSGKWVGKVHETFQSKGETGSLKNYIDHYPHQTIAEFLQSINEFSTLRAAELHKKGIRTNVIELLLYPFAKFWYTYLFKLGFLDGPAGFVYSFMMSFHSFLVRSKLHLLKN